MTAARPGRDHQNGRSWSDDVGTARPSDPGAPDRPPLAALALVVVLSVAAIAIGWNRKISFETLVHHNEAIHAFILGHRIAAVAIYVVAYVVTIALSLPGALILTLSGGFLFGGLVGAAAAGAGATIGATIIFMIAKSAFGEHLVRRAGPMAEKLAQGSGRTRSTTCCFCGWCRCFRFSWSIWCRRWPACALSTFVAATVIGIIPATFTFAFVGAGLDSVIRAQGAIYHACLASGRADCRLDFDVKAAVTLELLGALAALGLITLIPVAVKRSARGASPIHRVGRQKPREGMTELITPDICVIGAGAGGLSVAAAAAAFGVPVVLIEKARWVANA